MFYFIKHTMSIYRYPVLTGFRKFARFQIVRNKARDKRFPINSDSLTSSPYRRVHKDMPHCGIGVDCCETDFTFATRLFRAHSKFHNCWKSVCKDNDYLYFIQIFSTFFCFAIINNSIFYILSSQFRDMVHSPIWGYSAHAGLTDEIKKRGRKELVSLRPPN